MAVPIDFTKRELWAVVGATLLCHISRQTPVFPFFEVRYHHRPF